MKRNRGCKSGVKIRLFDILTYALEASWDEDIGQIRLVILVGLAHEILLTYLSYVAIVDRSDQTRLMYDKTPD